METEGSGGIQLTQPPPAKDADDAAAALALTKRARKRSRYLSPPYTDTDVQEETVAWEEEVVVEEEDLPDVSAAAALSGLLDAAPSYGQGVDPAALRFLTLHRSRNRTAAGGGGSSHDGGSKKPPSPGGGGAAADGGVGYTKLNLTAGPAMPGPVDGSPAPALAKKKKKNPDADGPMQDAAAPAGQAQAAGGHVQASQPAGFSGAANPAPPPPERKKKRYKKRAKSAGPSEQQHFGNPAALVLDYAAGAPLPSREHLVSTFRRFGLVIDSVTAVDQDRRRARVAFATRASAEAALSWACAGALGAAWPSLQDLPPIIARGVAAPPLPRLPLTHMRSNLKWMIAELKAKASSSPQNLVGEMQGLLAKVDKKLQGPATAAHQSSPLIKLSSASQHPASPAE